jgi:serine/threonine protein kinase
VHREYLKHIGDVIGKYRITAYLGRGYESDVYRVKDMQFGEIRSLKLLRGRGRTVLEEAYSAANVYHRLSRCMHVKRFRYMSTIEAQPGVGTRPYLVFDYIPGQTVEWHVNTNRRLPPGLLLSMICRATANIHRTGLAVGDFNRGRNILIESTSNRVVFCDLDWGIPGTPNTNQAEDLSELRKLGRWIFKSVGKKPCKRLFSVLAQAETVTEASKLINKQHVRF